MNKAWRRSVFLRGSADGWGWACGHGTRREDGRSHLAVLCGQKPASGLRTQPGTRCVAGGMAAQHARQLRVALVLGAPVMGKKWVGDRTASTALHRVPRRAAHAQLSVPRRATVGAMGCDVLGLRAGGPNGDRACQVCGSGLGHLPSLVRRTDTVHDAASCTAALRYHLVEWIPGLLATATRDRPITLILDEVHRSDDAVWQMLLRLGRDCPGSRLFVLATVRPAGLAKSRTALEALHALDQDARVRRIALASLTRQMDGRDLFQEGDGDSG